jgi:hypothetical protein
MLKKMAYTPENQEKSKKSQTLSTGLAAASLGRNEHSASSTAPEGRAIIAQDKRSAVLGMGPQ